LIVSPVPIVMMVVPVAVSTLQSAAADTTRTSFGAVYERSAWAVVTASWSVTDESTLALADCALVNDSAPESPYATLVVSTARSGMSPGMLLKFTTRRMHCGYWMRPKLSATPQFAAASSLAKGVSNTVVPTTTALLFWYTLLPKRAAVLQAVLRARNE